MQSTAMKLNNLLGNLEEVCAFTALTVRKRDGNSPSRFI
jgi:hypothetical protein